MLADSGQKDYPTPGTPLLINSITWILNIGGTVNTVTPKVRFCFARAARASHSLEPKHRGACLNLHSSPADDDHTTTQCQSFLGHLHVCGCVCAVSCLFSPHPSLPTAQVPRSVATCLNAVRSLFCGTFLRPAGIWRPVVSEQLSERVPDDAGVLQLLLLWQGESQWCVTTCVRACMCSIF